jgi:pSer/pThr/pTyr-binding forkhead associated (FHA) protein
MLTNLDVNPPTTVHCTSMRCGSCGWDNPPGIVFCTNCGKRLAEREAQTPAALTPGISAYEAPPQARYGTQVFFENRSSVGASAAPLDASRAIVGAVKCPGCGAPGEPGMRFCRECGTSLTQAASSAAAAGIPASASCPRCGLARDPGASFCRQCGASFRESGPLSGFTPQDTQAPAPSSRSATPRLVTLLKDGSEGRSIPLAEKDADVGGSEGDITFPDDPYISPRHARVVCRAGTYNLRDLDSVNGVYVRLRETVELSDRDMLLVGQQVLRFEVLGDGELPLGPAFQHGVMVFGTPEVARFARLVQYTTEGVARDVHYLFRDETVIGRENGDIVFTDDPFLSRRHAAIRVDHAGRRFVLSDLGSSNGTALRIRGEHVLKDADQFRIGRHLFRFEAGAAGGRVAR